jgi:CubicO group peptidase (beta-lactamase class C family)
MRVAGIPVLALLSACGAGVAPPPAPPPAFPELDLAIPTILREDRIRGAALVVGEGARILHRKAYGEATMETLFDLASVTKVVATTTAAMKLVEEGRLSLDEPVGNRLAPFASREIRIRDLLTHRSRLPAYLKPKGSGPEAILEEISALEGEKKEYTYS